MDSSVHDMIDTASHYFLMGTWEIRLWSWISNFQTYIKDNLGISCEIALRWMIQVLTDH